MLVQFVDWGIEILMLLILVSSVMSWVRPDPRNPFVKLINGIVEPIILPIRSILPTMGPLDLSPMVAMFLLYFLQRMLHNALAGG